MALPRRNRPTSDTGPQSGPQAVIPPYSYPLPERQVPLEPNKFMYVDITRMNSAMLDVRAKHYLKKLEYIPKPTGNERFQQVMLPIKEVRKGSPYVEAIWGVIDMKPPEGGAPRLMAAVNWSSGGGVGFPALPGMSMEEMWRMAKYNPAAKTALDQAVVSSFRIGYTDAGNEGFQKHRSQGHWQNFFNGKYEQGFSIGLHPTNFLDRANNPASKRNELRIHGSGRPGDGDEGVRGTWGCMTCTGSAMKVFIDAHLAALKAGASGAFVPPGTTSIRQGVDALHANRDKVSIVMNTTVPVFNPLVINERSPNYVAVKGQVAAHTVTAAAPIPAPSPTSNSPWPNNQPPDGPKPWWGQKKPITAA